MKFDKPFPHVVSTRLFNPSRLRRAVAEWPADDAPQWKHYEGNKRGFSDRDFIPISLRSIIEIGQEMLPTQLRAELGIDDKLVDDPSLHGAGLHETLLGGKLGMHVDFNQHPRTGLYRRVNAILYLNDDWDSSDGGALWLEGRSPADVKIILPELGVFVAWETADDRWHGHPVPLAVESRKSIAWYFYTAEQPPGFSEKHGTIYR